MDFTILRNGAPVELADLRAGDVVSFRGIAYTARDAAHARITDTIRGGGTPPFPIRGSAIYYAGPTPARPGEIIGSCGPTTSTRMDDYTPFLLERGLAVMIGKGKRRPDVIESMKQAGAVYLCAVGGAAALIKKHVTDCKEIAYHDLGCEAVRRLVFDDLPLIVGIDARGEICLR